MNAKSKPKSSATSSGSRKKPVAARKNVASPKTAPKSHATGAETPKHVPAASNTVGKRSYWQKNWYYLVAFVLALLVFGACAWFVHYDVAIGKERTLLQFINDWPDGLRLTFVVLTALGSVWAAAVVVAAAFLLRLYQLAWRLALSVFTAYGLLIFLKAFFERPRPGEVIPDLHVRITEIGFGFPSGHAAIATVLALTALTYLPRGWGWLIVVLYIGTVALSRMYLGVHAPFDVAAGFALGVGVVCFWRILPRFIKRIVRLA